MRFLGIDPGRKRIGLAISDLGETFSHPFKVLARRSLEQVVREVAEICCQEEIGAIVMGHPLNMDGSRGPAAREAEKLAALIAEAAGLPMEMWDERLSSVTAESRLLEADLTRAKRRKKIDKVAAQIILQGFLDARARRAQDDRTTPADE
ncbi:MAG: Holliday junction resolvase RuvX [Anaerolineaceae bacterium]|nr:Holliday junction resolvase RuvX [Anaerolineaceae bacterium]